MPPPGKDHRQPVLVGGGDDFGVPHRAAGLDDGGGAGGRDGVEAVAEREERVRRGDRSRERAARRPAPSSPRRSRHPRGSSGPRRSPACAVASVKITAFDFTCAQMRHAKRSASHSSAVGGRFVTTRNALRQRRAGPRLRASPTTSRSCTSIAPRIDRSSSPPLLQGGEVRGHARACSSSAPARRARPRRPTAR